MKLLSLLSVAALAGSVAATPVLEERGNHGKTQCYWRDNTGKWGGKTRYCCDWNSYKRNNNCCPNEKKCWYDPWDCRWECAEVKHWDWKNDCPTWYVSRKSDHQKRFKYYGGGSKQHHDYYKEDCKHGGYSDYLRYDKYKPNRHHGKGKGKGHH